jgi:hypothetical protein
VSRAPKPIRYAITTGPHVARDLTALEAEEAEIARAARAALDDLRRGRVWGNQLGERRVSGNLTGYARVKFDPPGQQPQRFRLVYRQIDDKTLEVVAFGRRGAHAVSRDVVDRLSAPQETAEPTASEDQQGS